LLNTHHKIQPKHPVFVYPICSTNGKRYRYGFNGMEKDNETYGEGNAYDFGARIYDSRLGRWLSLDPLMVKYPELSPYHSFGNSPLVFIDPSGKENVVYLVVLSSAFTPEGGNLTWNEIKAYVEETNAAYKSMGLETRMEIFSEAVSKTLDVNFDITKMDKTDAVMALGSPQNVCDWVGSKSKETKADMEDDLLDKKGDDGKVSESEMGGLASTSRYQNIIGMSGDKIKYYAKKFKTKEGKSLTKAQTFAITVLHETGHDAGLTHTPNADNIGISNNSSWIMQQADDFRRRLKTKTYSDYINNEKIPGTDLYRNQDFVDKMKIRFGDNKSKKNYEGPKPVAKKTN
jgi:RHS repeat-associated protein